MESMKILHATGFYPPYVGGEERHVYNLVKEQQLLGHDVHVITSNFPPQNQSEKNVTRLPILAKPKLVPICPTVFRALRENKSDIIHVHTPPRFFPESIAFYKLFEKGAPLITTYHLHNEGLDSISRAVWNVHNRLVMRWVFENTKRVIVLTEKYKTLVSSEFKTNPEKIQVIPNGVDDKIFNPRNYQTKSSRSEFSIFEENVILFIGRLVKEKGVDYLLKAMQVVKRHTNDVILVIVGTGQHESYLRSLCQKLDLYRNVRFMGKLSDDDIPKILSSADLLVLPSLTEGLPTVLLEAMAMEKPTVATDAGGNPEVVLNEKTGFVVERRNVTKMADAIISILSDKKRARSMGQLGRKLIVDKYSWEIVARKVLEVYEEALES